MIAVAESTEAVDARTPLSLSGDVTDEEV